MVQKKIDSRIRTLIENGVKLNQRTLMIIIGDNGKDQVDSQSPLHALEVACENATLRAVVLQEGPGVQHVGVAII